MKMKLGWLLVALMAGCGTNNKALHVEHFISRIQSEATDETRLVARLSGELSAATEFNLRYTLVAQLAAGEYVLKGTDGGAGRYFVHVRDLPVVLTYKGLTLVGKPSVETAPGGVFVGGDGAVFIYWQTDGDAGAATRVPAPALVATVVREVDQQRRNARLAREEDSRREAAEKLQRERSERERAEAQEAERSRAAAERLRSAQRKAALRAKLAEVSMKDRVQCQSAQCERAFAWAQAYLLKQADMRIQLATPTLIETHNADEEGRVQIRLLRVPAAGERWEIVLSAYCRDEREATEEVCLARLVDVYGGFLPHMQRQ